VSPVAESVQVRLAWVVNVLLPLPLLPAPSVWVTWAVYLVRPLSGVVTFADQVPLPLTLTPLIVWTSVPPVPAPW
jgi:hypothetical protein